MLQRHILIKIYIQMLIYNPNNGVFAHQHGITITGRSLIEY